MYKELIHKEISVYNSSETESCTEQFSDIAELNKHRYSGRRRRIKMNQLVITLLFVAVFAVEVRGNIKRNLKRKEKFLHETNLGYDGYGQFPSPLVSVY